MYQPPMLARPGAITIHPWSYQSLGPLLSWLGAVSGGAAWPAAGLVIFVPFYLPEATTITKMWWIKGAIAGNVDAGIYAEDETLLVSLGSTPVSAGTNQVQVGDITDTTLGRGRYYMAMVADTVTTLTIFRTIPPAGICQSLGLLQQASVTLPLSANASPATFAKYAQAYIPLFGVQGYRTVGP